MNITYDTAYNGYTINNNVTQGCYTNILHRIDAHTQDMLEKHSKVLTVRFDLRTSAKETASPLDSKKMEHFVENLTVDLTRNNPLPGKGKKKASSKNSSKHKVDPRIIIVQEQHGAEKSHGHGLAIVNGNAKKESWDIMQRVERQFKNVLKDEYQPGLVDYCDQKGPNSYMIQRNDAETLGAFYHQTSYLAKVRGKDGREKGAWRVRGTRPPKK